MNTMHEMLMPELVEMKNAERLAEVASRRWVGEVTKVSRPDRSGRIDAKLHLPRLRRSSTAGTI